MSMKTDRAEPRELTRSERAAIRKLVTDMCANYDQEYGCLPLDCPCYMLNKWWTGAYCKYFQNAVLPLDPDLEATLTGRVAPEMDAAASHLCVTANGPIAPRPVQTPPGANDSGNTCEKRGPTVSF